MNEIDVQLLEKLGIIVTGVEYKYLGTQGSTRDDLTTEGTFTLDDSKFIPMCRLIKIVDMICESKNPMVEKQFHNLITLLELTKENKK